MIRRKLSACVLATGTAVLSLQGLAGAATTVHPETAVAGAGATFQLNQIEQWKADFKKATGVSINYAGIGSGAGRTQLINGTVDFAASDVPASDAETKKLNDKYGSFVYVPDSAGAVAILYNIKGVGAGLKLTASSLAKIFSGNVAYWDDPAVKADNADVALPHTPVQVYVRSDKSGTSGVFTDYLTAAAPADWSAGSTQQFPTTHQQIGKAGSDGVSNAVKASDGGIGYAEISFAKERGLGMAMIKNAAGTYEVADSNGTLKMLDTATVNPNGTLKLNFTTTAPGVYPIATASYLLIPTKLSAAKGDNLKAFVTYALTPAAQAKVARLGYSPLPERILAGSRATLAKVTPAPVAARAPVPPPATPAPVPTTAAPKAAPVVQTAVKPAVAVAAPAPAAVPSVTTTTGALARTGSSSWLLALVGSSLVLVGWFLRRWSSATTS